MNENEEKDDYLERVLNVEKATFTPAVFLTSGGMSSVSNLSTDWSIS